MPPASQQPGYTEAERLQALARYDIMDTPRECELDDVVKIVARICGVPMAMISLVDDNLQWFKATVGLEASETPRDVAFCSVAIDQTETLVVGNASHDRRFLINPLVTGLTDPRFYAGAQLITRTGLRWAL